MKLTLSAPSKTFLTGEYAVLAQGPALVLCTHPRFELNVTHGEGKVTGIPARSPSAKWIEQRRPLLAKYDVEFVDPYQGAGGFGASGAQFLMVHALTTFLQSSFERTLSGPDLKDLWSDYQTLSSGIGSGADLLAQSCGGVAHVEMGTLTTHAREWPYPELAWSVVRTQQKIPTHEHLQNLDRAVLSLLVTPARECVESFGQSPPEVFISKLKSFTSRLAEMNLQAAHSQSLMKLLDTQDWCLLAKGCGALGADTVLFFYPVDARERVSAFVKKTSLQVVTGSTALSGGLEVRWH